MTPRPMRAVVYARYSSHNQGEQSIEGQLHDAYQFAEQEGYTIIREYIDRAITGKTDARPQFQRMIDDAPKGQFAFVIVWKLDRFARNRYDSAIYKARLKKYGVKVVSVKESITDAPEGIILEGMLESMAEYYSANLSQNIRRGLRETTSKGLFCGGTVPFGYKSVNQKLVPDENTAPIMRKIFEDYGAGVPMKEIIEGLKAKGITATRGGELSYTSFMYQLSNPAYIGKAMYQGKVVPGLCEPLISDELFQRVQDIMKARAHAPGAGKAKVNYLLQGKIFCGHCGAAMNGESGRSHTGTIYNYYCCRGKKKLRNCKKKNERKDDIEKFVVNQTRLHVLNPTQARKIAKAAVEEFNRSFNSSRVRDLERTLRKKEKDSEILVDSLLEAPKPVHAAIYAKLEKLEAEKQDIESQITTLNLAAGVRITENDVVTWLNQFCSGDPDNPEFQRKIIDVFVSSVYVYDERIVVFYNIKESKSEIDFDSLESALYGSGFVRNAPPFETKSEPEMIFINNTFGMAFVR